MASKQPFKVLFVLGVVVLATICTGSGADQTPSGDEEGLESEGFKVKTRQPQDEAAEKETKARESSDSWAEWAKEKISGGLGLKQDDEYDPAQKTKEKVLDTASGRGQQTTEKAKDIKDTAAEAVKAAMEKANEATNAAKEKAYEATKVVKDKLYETKTAAEETASKAAEKVRDASPAATERANEAKQKTGQTVEEIKNKAYEKAEETKEAKRKTEEVKNVAGEGHYGEL